MMQGSLGNFTDAPWLVIAPVDAFFTSTSAVCVTGLIVLDTPGGNLDPTQDIVQIFRAADVPVIVLSIDPCISCTER